MTLPFNPQPKSRAIKSVRIKQTQKQLGSIPDAASKALKERSGGVCEMCNAAPATQRAHIVGRKHLKQHDRRAGDLAHFNLIYLCVECHQLIDRDPLFMRIKRMMGNIIDHIIQTHVK